MSFKLSSSDSYNGSNVTRFTLDGVVAEMVIEVDDQEPLLSPTKALTFNGLDNYDKIKISCLKHKLVALDSMLKMDDMKISQEQKELTSEQDKTDIALIEFKEDPTPFKSDNLNVGEVLMDEKCDLKEVKESDILDVDKESQPTEAVEILPKGLNKMSEDELTIDEKTEINKGVSPKQHKDNSFIVPKLEKDEAELSKDEIELPKEDENKSCFAEIIETIQKYAEKDENKPTEINQSELFQITKNKSPVELSETNKAQSSESGKNELTVKMSEINEVKSPEKDGNEASLKDMIETNKAHLSETDGNKSVEREVTATVEFQSSEMIGKSALNRQAETVKSESTKLELLDSEMLLGVTKSSKLPLKKKEFQESEKIKEIKEESEPETRALRTRPSEKEKKDVKSTISKKRKDISSKSTPVPVKKAKIVKEDNPKKSNKRGLLETDKTETVGKRLRSATQDNSQIQRRSQVSSSTKSETDKKAQLKAKKPDTKNGKTQVKISKLELKAKKPEIKKVKTEIKNSRPELKTKKSEIKNTKTDTKNAKPDLKSKKPEIKNKKPEIKRQSLRNTTLQKSGSTPASVIPLKPKVYNLNPGKAKNLGVFSEIKEKVNESDSKYLRNLYRILFDQWPPKDLDKIKKKILNFEGYNFKKKSQDLQNREQILKKMPDTSITEVCKILDLRVGSKENMISDIIKFLLKPIKIVISTVDPFDSSMQPIVKLEKVSFDEYLNKKAKKEVKIPEPVKRSKRERYPSSKLEIYVSDISEKLPAPFIKEEHKKSLPEIKTEKSSKGETSNNASVKQSTANKTKTAFSKGSLAAKYAKKKKKGFKLSHKKVSHYLDAQKKVMKLAAKIQTTNLPFKKTFEMENIDETIEPDSEIKLEPIIEEVREIREFEDTEESEALKFSENDSKHLKRRESTSDATLSSDESKQVIKTGSPRKRVSHKRVGKPLRYFTKIKENILNSNFSALQRLHILLFGASDKADNLKGNILAFGGFPFLEGSEEWKQKEFLLSLLAQNTLREYLNLLCIEYTDDDQKTLIKKLMKFLAAPNDNSSGDQFKTRVISSELVNRSPVQLPKVYSVPIKKKKGKKAVEKKSRTRKVLMDEAQVKRLEADLAREQRIMERDRKLHEEQTKKLQAKTTAILEKSKKMPPFVIKDGMESDKSLEKKAALTAKQTDAELLNALLQTVYKRRALKKAGVVISAPKKETLTRLGELANVKFLVVTANYSDLDVLHHLIYMTEANKAKVRKNILDFAGFNFSEDTQSYKDRMEFLNSLGYDISKRIAFLLGLCPFKTEIEPQDLNELIMYFLMHPCKSKQIPIRHLPQTFFRKDIPKEICQLMQKHLVDMPVSTTSSSANPEEIPCEKQPEISVVEENEPSTSLPVRQKAKKSFKSSCLPSVQRKGLSPSISTLPLKAPKPLLKPMKPSQPILLPGSSNKVYLPAISQSILPKAILKAPAPAITIPSTPNAPQEVLIQQQTPDGQQKTFKLIKLPAAQAIHSNVQSVLKNTPQQASITSPAPIPPVLQNQPVTFTQPVQVSPVISGSLPPGLIFFKGSPAVPVNEPLPNIMQTVPVMLNPSDTSTNPIVSVDNTSQDKVIVPEEEKSDIPVESEYVEDSVKELNSLTDSSPPTDDDLFNSIQEVIHSSDFENITLKNVIDRVAAQYSAFDLTQRHMYMKECIKKIIMGT